MFASSIVLSLAACGQPAAPAKTENNNKNVTVNVLLTDNPYTRGLKQFAKDFENKTGIKANVDVVGLQVSEQRIQLEFSGKTGNIDVAYMPFQLMQKWAKADWIQPLDEMVAQAKDLNKDDFIPITLTSLTYQDKLWGLPGFAEAGMFAYRKDILEKNGINEAPKTWDELIAAAKKIKASGEIAPIALRAQRGQGLNMFVFPTFMWSHGGKYFENFPTDLKTTLNSPENLAALKTYVDLVQNYGPEGAANYSYPDVVAGVQQGKVAMAIDGTSVVSQFFDKEKSQFADKMAAALIPAGKAGSSPMISVHGLALSKYSKHPKETFEFIKWATSAETQKKIALSGPYLDFTRKSVADDKNIQEKFNVNNIDLLKLKLKSLESGRSDYRPLLPEWPEFGDLIGTEVNAAASKAKTPEKALEEAQNKVADVIKRSGYQVK